MAKTRKLHKAQKIAKHTILTFDVNPDPKIFDAEFERVKEIHKKEKKDYLLQRGYDIVITCGDEQKSFTLEGFKKLMGFKPGFNPPKSK